MKNKSKLKILTDRLFAEKGITLLEFSKIEPPTLNVGYMSTLINKGRSHPALFARLVKHLPITYNELYKTTEDEDDK